MAKLILFNKPYQVMSQFSDAEQRRTLADFISVKGVYPAGRLDYDSEGLLLLTDSGKLQHFISHPSRKQSKKYWVLVEKIPDEKALALLREGVLLKDGVTQPANVKLIDEPEYLWPRDPPVRQRRNIPVQWLELEITEGRNRQVRRMTAAVGYPTLRLIRFSIGSWSINGLQPGAFREEQIYVP